MWAFSLYCNAIKVVFVESASSWQRKPFVNANIFPFLENAFRRAKPREADAVKKMNMTAYSVYDMKSNKLLRATKKISQNCLLEKILHLDLSVFLKQQIS
ncbi:Small ribosomal subunit protein eS1A [Trichinella pseudospiralis]